MELMHKMEGLRSGEAIQLLEREVVESELSVTVSEFSQWVFRQLKKGDDEKEGGKEEEKEDGGKEEEKESLRAEEVTPEAREAVTSAQATVNPKKRHRVNEEGGGEEGGEGQSYQLPLFSTVHVLFEDEEHPQGFLRKGCIVGADRRDGSYHVQLDLRPGEGTPILLRRVSEHKLFPLKKKEEEKEEKEEKEDGERTSKKPRLSDRFPSIEEKEEK